VKNIEKISKEGDINDFYNKHGYVVLRNILPLELIKKLQNDIASFFFNEAVKERSISKESIDSIIISLNDQNPKRLHEIQIAASRLASFHTLAGESYQYVPKIVGNTSLVFLNQVGFLLGIPNDLRLSYDWHQDGTYHNDGVFSVIHVWFPIFNTSSLFNGAMSLLDGSHIENLLDYSKTKHSKTGYTSNKPLAVDEKIAKYEELCCSLELGDCLFFGDNLIHRSNLNQSDICRIIGILKFSQVPNYSNSQSSLVGV
jgi:ectoine hydroxylase-related dioxygenase (phytanoyl-CoA dioxygenase family)